MSFSLWEFIKKGFLDAVGKMADYQIILNATGYFEKGVLLEEDLAEINAKIEEQYPVQEEISEDITVDEILEENTEPLILE